MEGYRQYGSLVQRHYVVTEVPQLHFRERVGAEVDVRALVLAYTRYCTLNEVSQQQQKNGINYSPCHKYGFRIPLLWNVFYKYSYRRTWSPSSCWGPLQNSLALRFWIGFFSTTCRHWMWTHSHLGWTQAKCESSSSDENLWLHCCLHWPIGRSSTHKLILMSILWNQVTCKVNLWANVNCTGYSNNTWHEHHTGCRCWVYHLQLRLFWWVFESFPRKTFPEEGFEHYLEPLPNYPTMC